MGVVQPVSSVWPVVSLSLFSAADEPFLVVYLWLTEISVSLSTSVIQWLIIELFGPNFFDLIEW